MVQNAVKPHKCYYNAYQTREEVHERNIQHCDLPQIKKKLEVNQVNLVKFCMPPIHSKNNPLICNVVINASVAYSGSVELRKNHLSLNFTEIQMTFSISPSWL